MVVLGGLPYHVGRRGDDVAQSPDGIAVPAASRRIGNSFDGRVADFCSADRGSQPAAWPELPANWRSRMDCLAAKIDRILARIKKIKPDHPRCRLVESQEIMEKFRRIESFFQRRGGEFEVLDFAGVCIRDHVLILVREGS